jgi:hypothetical protein
MINDNSTIGEAKEHLVRHSKEGVGCPLCSRFVKIYPRTLNAGMCKSLILVYQLTKRLKPENGWLHIQREFTNNYKLNATAMDYIQLERWDLIEEMMELGDDKKKNVGYWRINKKGIDFIFKKISLPKKVYVLRNETLKFSENMVFITEVSGKGFNYWEMMKDCSYEEDVADYEPKQSTFV